MEKEILDKLDQISEFMKFPNRSRTLRYLINQFYSKTHDKDEEVAGAIILVYNHHKRELQNQSTRLQHNRHHLILSVQHVHIDHDNCLETIAVKGKANDLEELAHNLIALKGIQQGELILTGSL